MTISVKAALDFLIPALHEQLSAAREYQVAIAKARRRKSKSKI